MELSIDFVKQLKQHILASRYLVAKMANAESLKLYFIIGKMVDEESQLAHSLLSSQKIKNTIAGKRSPDRLPLFRCLWQQYEKQIFMLKI